jgi:hypothetical protein
MFVQRPAVPYLIQNTHENTHSLRRYCFVLTGTRFQLFSALISLRNLDYNLCTDETLGMCVCGVSAR